MSITEFICRVNELSSKNIPFVFLIDFEMERPLVFPVDQIDPDILKVKFNGWTNVPDRKLQQPPSLQLVKHPLSFQEYKNKFNLVYRHLVYGDSYLTNLTAKTEIVLPCSLEQLFHLSHARYKVCYRNHFLVFSPETFVKIMDGKVYAYPMKGTIDASVPQAEEKILTDAKEMAEHVTIVDLIRNDISQVASNVKVLRFRYIDKIKTSGKDLLQVSSEIAGELAPDYCKRLGNIIVSLLPAGSVSGAPKPKTVEIIRQAEGEKRGFYTGVCGYFDGRNLDSAVMIRFIEQSGEKYFYRSGGGITAQSVVEGEYQEIIDKVYVPLD